MRWSTPTRPQSLNTTLSSSTGSSLLSGSAGPLWLVAAGLVVLLVVLETAEGVGLRRATRWGEYLTFVMTTRLLRPEALQLVASTSPGSVIGMVINAAVVLYLLISKRLFDLRGGAPAVRAERDHDIGWAALQRHLPAGRPGTRAERDQPLRVEN